MVNSRAASTLADPTGTHSVSDSWAAKHRHGDGVSGVCALTCKRSQLKSTLAAFPADGVETFPSLGCSVHACWSFGSIIHDSKNSN